MNTTDSVALGDVRGAKRLLETTVLAAIRAFEGDTGLHVRGFDLTTRSAIDRQSPEVVFVQAEVRL